MCTCSTLTSSWCRAWNFPCYFRIFRHASGAKCENNMGNPKLCSCLWPDPAPPSFRIIFKTQISLFTLISWWSWHKYSYGRQCKISLPITLKIIQGALKNQYTYMVCKHCIAHDCSMSECTGMNSNQKPKGRLSFRRNFVSKPLFQFMSFKVGHVICHATGQEILKWHICVCVFHIVYHLLWWASGGGATNSPSHVNYMGGSYSR